MGNVTRTARSATLTPLEAVACGLIAGAVGTAAMDTLLFVRYRRGGGKTSAKAWELSEGLSSWEEAPAPAHVGKRLVEGLFEVEIPPSRVPLVNNVTHWAYGIFNGVQFGIVAGSLRRPRVVYGLPFGAAVWGASYVILPAAKLYQPIWEYDLETLANDLSVHLLYGLGTASALNLLTARRR